MRIGRVTLALFGLLGITGLASVSRADDRKDIDALYAKLSKAVTSKDIKGVMATGAKGFTYTEAGRTMTADQASAQMQQQFQMVKGSPKCTFKVVSCKIKGKTADVVSTDSTEMSIAGQDGKPHVLVSNGKSKDTLVKTDKGWLMKTVVVVSDTMTMDGKPFDPSKAMPDHK